MHRLGFKLAINKSLRYKIRFNQNHKKNLKSSKIGSNKNHKNNLQLRIGYNYKQNHIYKLKYKREFNQKNKKNQRSKIRSYQNQKKYLQFKISYSPSLKTNH